MKDGKDRVEKIRVEYEAQMQALKAAVMQSRKQQQKEYEQRV